ncbi:MAG: helix-turn-helix domain-containing GNAT family N-acetyltransferase [Acidobacteriia bacterium]|nr:helix-turn-helix domain-containing GNAT family N-acetyltransferase [Terriglobia bacterium]
MTANAGFGQRIDAVRQFNRFYTRKIGVLRERLLSSPFSLTKARVLYELAHRQNPTASELGKEMGLDGGYLSRILRGFERRGLLARKASQADARQSLLSLTSLGRKTFLSLDTHSQDEVGAMLRTLPVPEQTRLIAAMRVIENLLSSPSKERVPYLLRPHQPGDMGWVVHRHGTLYAQEYGYDQQFEGLVASIVAEFLHHYNPKHERCWIAERNGEFAGSVFLVRKSKTVAKLRLLLVEPAARGLGIGARLVGECVRFARQVGYRKITLWTQSDLYAARHIYRQSGFRLLGRKPHHSFGRDLVAETWELKL